MPIRIAPQTGVAFTLKMGQTLRVIDPLGEQVADLTAFTHDAPRSWLSSGKSLDFSGKIYLTTGDILYSNLSKPMFAIIADTVGRHDFLLAPCSQETFDKLYDGHSGHHPSCLSNLSEALSRFGFSAVDIPGTFNIFMDVSIMSDGRIEIAPPRSKASDYIELEAQQDLIVGLTACSAEKTNNGHPKPILYEILSADHAEGS